MGAVDLFSIQDRDDVADDRIARVGRFVVRPCAPAVPDRIDIQYAIVRQELVVSPAGPAGLVHLQSGHQDDDLAIGFTGDGIRNRTMLRIDCLAFHARVPRRSCRSHQEHGAPNAIEP